MDNDIVLQVNNVSKSFDATRALRQVSLTVRKGEVHALVGENGSGKTTLMNILFGNPIIEQSGGYEGSIGYLGEPVVIPNPQYALELGIGMVHQEFTLLPSMSVVENVKLNREKLKARWPSRVAPMDWDAMRRDVRNAFKSIDINLDESAAAGKLPIGHKQFVEIIREIDKKSVRLLIFDEPTAVLSEDEARRLTAAIKRISETGTAVIYISHRLHEVIEVADTITVLRDGAVVRSLPASETHVDELAAMMVGYDIDTDSLEPPPANFKSQPIMSIRDYMVEMPGERVCDIDLDIYRGEILGVAGLSGQGKLGIINGLMGLYPATGSIQIDGKPLPLGDSHSAMMSGIAFVSENRRDIGLIPEESVVTNICYPQLQVLGNFLRATWLPGGGLLDRNAMHDYCAQAITDFDIRCESASQQVKFLSGGNQQKLCLARALGLKPTVLFIAEPTRGIDIGAKMRLLEALLVLAGKGMAIVMISSELKELRMVAQRIAVFHAGKIAAILPRSASLEEFGLAISGELAHKDVTVNEA